MVLMGKPLFLVLVRGTLDSGFQLFAVMGQVEACFRFAVSLLRLVCSLQLCAFLLLTRPVRV